MVHSLKIKKKTKQKKKNIYIQIGDWKYIYQKELDWVCFQHDMAYGDFKDLNERIAANKLLSDKAFNKSI